MLVGRAFPQPEGPARILWWLALLAASLLAVTVVDRAARRLLPLAILLRLGLIFPDRAPSRFAVARVASSTRQLEARVRRARERGIDDDPSRAAETILALIAALSGHDRRTRGHSERVRVFSDLLASALRLPVDDRDRLRWAALLHDIGKLEVSATLLNKPGELDADEWSSLRRHPEEGARLAGPLLPWLGEWGQAIVQHHERFDGTGYPHGLSGEEISLAGRILAVSDSFDAMTAAFPYRRPLTVVDARRELTRCTGSQFDPSIVRAFLNVSLGPLRWTVGLSSWLAHLPFVAARPHGPALRPGRQQVAGTAMAMVTSLALLTATPAGATGTATLHTLGGGTEVRAAGSVEFRPGQEGRNLKEGDTIRTASDGRAEIEFFDGSETRLDRGTSLRLRSLTPITGPPRGRKILSDHTAGRTFNRVADAEDPASRFEVHTPSAVASVRGTTFFTEIRTDGWEAFGVLDGEVLLRVTDGTRYQLHAGAYVEIGPDLETSGPRPLTAEELGSDWLVYNLCTLDDEATCERKRDDEQPAPEPPEPDHATAQEPPAIVAPSVLGVVATAADGPKKDDPPRTEPPEDDPPRPPPREGEPPPPEEVEPPPPPDPCPPEGCQPPPDYCPPEKCPPPDPCPPEKCPPPPDPCPPEKCPPPPDPCPPDKCPPLAEARVAEATLRLQDGREASR